MSKFDDSLKKIRDASDPELVDAVRSGKMSVKLAALIADCRVLSNAGNNVEALRKYRADTGASLKAAQQALYNK
jgi:hypothetical protein